MDNKGNISAYHKKDEIWDDRVMPLCRVARRLGVTEHTVRAYCRKGLIPHFRTPTNGYRILKEDFERYEQERTVEVDRALTDSARETGERDR